MVKRIFFITLLAFFLSLNFAPFLLASEFNASVSSHQVNLGSTFFLNLTLKDSSFQEAPVLSSLKDHFLIQSQQQFTSTTIHNGKASSSISWKISLTPKREGTVEIPAITIRTAEGILSAQPITIEVIKGSASQSKVEHVGASVIAKVSNASPYKNEPFLYTALLASKMPLYHVQAEKIQVDEAIVELLEKPKLEERVIEGVLHNVVELTYLITPLKSGSLTIPSITIQGASPQKRKDEIDSFYSDDFDPFAFMQGFGRLKPFTLMTEEIPLEVLPAITEMSPWLPAKELTLEEEWSPDQTLRVGEPFSRGLQIKAEGLKASQLPSLEELQNQSSMFKIYGDKPQEQEKIFQGNIHSQRKEQFTLIPQQAGTWELPEISIEWWDTVKKKKRTSTLPGRTLQILPAPETATLLPEELTPSPASIMNKDGVHLNAPSPYILYGIIAILTFFLMTSLLWGFILQRKIANLTKDPSQKPVKMQTAQPKKLIARPKVAIQKEKREKLPDLNPT